MNEHTEGTSAVRIKRPHGLSPRIQWLRDFYFQGFDRPWHNQYTCSPWIATPWPPRLIAG